MSPGTNTAVVHLVWGPLGPKPLARFAASYRDHPAGEPHELVVVLNGVEPSRRDRLLGELDGIEHRVVALPDPVQDLAAYAFAARVLEHRRLCILNSHSRILADGWLAHFLRTLSQKRAGLVGASGSWASMLSYGLYQLGLPSVYRNVFGRDRRATVAQFESLQQERTAEPLPVGEMRRRIHTLIAVSPFFFGFRRFPAHHVRSNAFALEREILLELIGAGPRRKTQAYRLESGRSSLTVQVEAAGLQAVVVDRAGGVHAPRDWPASKTFWQGRQENLLVADNQTDWYEQADLERRLLLSRYAWGERAAPRAGS